MKKIYLLNNHYTINFLRYLNINKNHVVKYCINNKQTIIDNKHLTKLLIDCLKEDFLKIKIKWFWCFTHSAFINILEQAGTTCVFRLNYLNYNMLLNNLYKYWSNSNCDNCKNYNSCCIHKTKEKSSTKHIGYLCVFKINH